jgi:glutathione S-transferase
VLNAHLSSRKYFLGDDFSALDVLLGGGLNFLMMAKLVEPTSVLTTYCARITDRPACRKMMVLDKR